jgi:hypothetical protein
LLKKILPDSLEYVVILRKTPIQKNLYKEFVKFIQKELTGEDAAYYNPLKAHAVCSKVRICTIFNLFLPKFRFGTTPTFSTKPGNVSLNFWIIPTWPMPLTPPKEIF